MSGRVFHDAAERAAGVQVRVEALFGFRGGDFTGQRTFTADTNSKGEWSIIGFKSGIWIFDVSAPGRLPDAVVLPFNVAMAPASGVGGDMPAWHPVLHTAPVPQTPAGAALADAAAAARTGDKERVHSLLVRVADSTDVDVLLGAGHVCLLVRDAPTARPFFQRAFERDPQSFGAALGMASTALMQRDFDAAAAAFGQARDRTKDRDERSYLTAAIGDLNKVSIQFRPGPE